MAKSRVDYHAKDLSGSRDRDFKELARQLELNLFQADFSYANLQGVDFSGLSLREADFSHSKLKGAKFNGADLSGAKFMHALVDADTDSPLEGVDFSSARIQGTDFSSASLANAQFVRVRAGLSHDLHIRILTLIALLGPGFTAAIASTFFLHFFRTRTASQKSTLPGQKPTRFTSFGVFLTSVFIVAGIRAAIHHFLGSTYVFGHVLFGVLLIIALLIFAIVMSDSETDPSSIFIIAIAALSPLAVRYFTHNDLVAGIFGAVVGAFIGCWFARLAICKNEKMSWLNFEWLWRMYVQFASGKGTVFNDADLTGADFTSADLRGASFQNARIAKTRWHKVKYLDCAYVGRNNYLRYSGIRYLLVVGEWEKYNNFDGLDLRGLDLKEAKLNNTRFVGTDLSYADLRCTDLSYANLKNASLDNANLEGANLTGACIQSWSTNEKTVLKDVVCNFVYLKDKDATDPEKGIQERLPDAADDDFNPGDFETLFSKDSAVLQLLVRNSDDRKALAAAFQELVQDRNTHYTFQGFEVIGKNALVKIRVSQGTNRAAVKSKFYQTLKQSMQTVQQDAEIQDRESQPLVEFIPKLMLALEEIKEIVTNNPVSVGTYNVFQQVSAQRFIQGDSVSTDNNSQTLQRKENNHSEAQ